MASEGDDPSSRKVSVDYSLLKGFVAGVIFSHFDKRLALGLLVGTLTGAYVQQNYEGIPNVEEKARNLMQSIRETMDKKKWSLETSDKTFNDCRSESEWTRRHKNHLLYHQGFLGLTKKEIMHVAGKQCKNLMKLNIVKPCFQEFEPENIRRSLQRLVTLIDGLILVFIFYWSLMVILQVARIHKLQYLQ